MQSLNLTFIGAGNMARSLVGGLVANGFSGAQITVSDKHPEPLQALQVQFGVQTQTDNLVAVQSADVVVVAVKPKDVQVVLTPLQSVFADKPPLLISVAAGVRTQALQHYAGGAVPVVRCMPNTPALVCAGATGLFATVEVSDTQRDIAESLLRSVGVTHWVLEEALLDVVTGLSGSGPAYFYAVMEALHAAAVEGGLAAEDAKLLIVQTALGAARLALESDSSLSELRSFVTSPGGTTEAALQVLQAAKVPEAFAQALKAARDRAAALADEFDP